MTIKVEFMGVVKGVREFEWGTVHNVAHSQRKKDEQGNWVTAGYDYIDVICPEKYTEGDLITVVGRLTTKRYEKRDGSQGMGLQVRADSTEKTGTVEYTDKRNEAAVMETWPTAKIGGELELEAPF